MRDVSQVLSPTMREPSSRGIEGATTCVLISKLPTPVAMPKAMLTVATSVSVGYLTSKRTASLMSSEKRSNHASPRPSRRVIGAFSSVLG